MIGSGADYGKMVQRKDLEAGEKLELHELTGEAGGYRVTVFDADDLEWDWEDFPTLDDAKEFFDKIKCYDDVDRLAP